MEKNVKRNKDLSVKTSLIIKKILLANCGQNRFSSLLVLFMCPDVPVMNVVVSAFCFNHLVQ